LLRQGNDVWSLIDLGSYGLVLVGGGFIDAVQDLSQPYGQGSLVIILS
jgi:hypothetical protein